MIIIFFYLYFEEQNFKDRRTDGQTDRRTDQSTSLNKNLPSLLTTWFYLQAKYTKQLPAKQCSAYKYRLEEGFKNIDLYFLNLMTASLLSFLKVPFNTIL